MCTLGMSCDSVQSFLLEQLLNICLSWFQEDGISKRVLKEEPNEKKLGEEKRMFTWYRSKNSVQ